jgi:hypothetical protein
MFVCVPVIMLGERVGDDIKQQHYRGASKQGHCDTR